MIMVPVRLPDGREIKLSAGQHNDLQAAIVHEFCPRFAPHAVLLYIGDTAEKIRILEEEELEQLNIPANVHDKLPDVVVVDKEKNWLFLIEAVTSHGPVSPKRHAELEEMLQDCDADRIYVTAFPDKTAFRQYVADIAWETEVWVADNPDHLVHFNGHKFLGPY